MATQLKVLIFILLTLIFNFFFWYQTLNIFKIKNVQIPDLVYLGVVFLFFLIFLLLQFVLTEERSVSYFAIFLLGLTFILIYFWQFGLNLLIYFLISILMFLILLMISYELMGLEKDDRLKLSLIKIWQRGLPTIVIAFSLVISTVYYFHPLLKLAKNKIELPEELINLLIKPAFPLIREILPLYDQKMTIDEILAFSLVAPEKEFDIKSLVPEILTKIPPEKLMTNSFEELLKDPEIKTLIKEQLLKKSKNIDPRLIVKQREDLSKSLGIKLTGKETLNELFNKLINIKLTEFIGPYSKLISLFIVILLFFILKFILGIIGIIAIIFARLFFEILKGLKIVKVIPVSKTGEILKL